MKTEKKVELLLKKNRFKGGGETKSVLELEELKVFKIKKTAYGITRDISLPLTLEHQVSTRRSYILNKYAAKYV